MSDFNADTFIENLFKPLTDIVAEHGYVNVIGIIALILGAFALYKTINIMLKWLSLKTGTDKRPDDEARSTTNITINSPTVIYHAPPGDKHLEHTGE